MGEDEKRTAAKRWRKRGKSQRFIWNICSWETRKREDISVPGCEGKGDKGHTQYSSSEEDGGEWVCRRLMAWVREIGLESADIIVNSDNEPALTSLVASWVISGPETNAHIA